MLPLADPLFSHDDNHVTIVSNPSLDEHAVKRVRSKGGRLSPRASKELGSPHVEAPAPQHDALPLLCPRRSPDYLNASSAFRYRIRYWKASLWTSWVGVLEILHRHSLTKNEPGAHQEQAPAATGL